MQPNIYDWEEAMYAAAALACLALAFEAWRDSTTSATYEPRGQHLTDEAVAALDAGHTVTVPRYQAPDLEIEARAVDQDGDGAE